MISKSTAHEQLAASQALYTTAVEERDVQIVQLESELGSATAQVVQASAGLETR